MMFSPVEEQDCSLPGNGHRGPVCSLTVDLYRCFSGFGLVRNELLVTALWLVDGLFVALLNGWWRSYDRGQVFLCSVHGSDTVFMALKRSIFGLFCRYPERLVRGRVGDV